MSAGVRPSLSVHGVPLASDDFFSQMRSAFDVERAIINNKFEPRPENFNISARDAFEFATLQGAKAIGQDHRLGTIEAGKVADLLFVRMDSPNMLPVLEPINSFVFHANVGDIDTVLIDGNPVKRDGKLLADVKRVRERIEESVARLFWGQKTTEVPRTVKPHIATMPRCLCGTC